jgi:hypothetical protein
MISFEKVMTAHSLKALSVTRARAVVLKATQKKASARDGSALEMRMELLERCEPANEAFNMFRSGLLPFENLVKSLQRPSALELPILNIHT